MTGAVAFHTCCPKSGLAVCHCPHSSEGQVNPDHFLSTLEQRARATWSLWQDQSRLFPTASDPVDIQLPRARQEPAVSQSADGLPDRQTAERRVAECSRAVQHAIYYAAQCSAAAGMPFNPGIDIGVDLSNLRGISQMQVLALEQKAAAVHQAIKGRMEYAQAQAAHLAGLPVPPSSATMMQNVESHPASLHSNGRHVPAASIPTEPSSSSPVAHSIQSRAFALPGHEPHQLQAHPRTPSQPAASLKPSSNPQQKAQHPKPQPARHKAGGASKGSSNSKLRRLRLADVRASLQGQWLQFFWPDDSSWWRAQVTQIDLPSTLCTLLYQNGEEETDCNLGQLVSKGEVAWLDEENGVTSVGAAAAAAAGDSKRRSSNSLASARMSGDPESVVGPNVLPEKVNKRARSAGMRSRASGSNLKLPPHLSDPDAKSQPNSAPPKGQSNDALSQRAAPKRARTGSRYKSESDNDISSASESDGEDFVPVKKPAPHPKPAARLTPQVPSQQQLPHNHSTPAPGLGPILALDTDAIGRWVSITPLRQQSTPGQTPQAIAARVVKMHAGRGFVVVATSNGAALELHQGDEGRVFKVAMLPAGAGQ